MISNKIKKSIKPLHVNGLDGRILRMPAPKNKKKQILLLYGHHASLERLSGLAEVMNEYGAVTMPDLPGLGGMSSFYTIGQKPTLDNYADYLASIVKLYYKRKRVTVVAMSFAVPITVRMLQKYPELRKHVEIVASIAGFVRRDEFKFDKPTYWGLRTLAAVFELRIPAAIMSSVVLNKPVVTAVYRAVSKRHSKMKDATDKRELNRRIAFEVGLWKMNDVRTRMYTMTTMFTLDLCNEQVPGVPAVHVSAGADRYFDNNIVVEHLRVIFEKVESVTSIMPNHAPSIMADAEEAKMYVPQRLQKILNKQ